MPTMSKRLPHQEEGSGTQLLRETCNQQDLQKGRSRKRVLTWYRENTRK